LVTKIQNRGFLRYLRFLRHLCYLCHLRPFLSGDIPMTLTPLLRFVLLFNPRPFSREMVENPADSSTKPVALVIWLKIRPILQQNLSP
jgi:hypothetical protein